MDANQEAKPRIYTRQEFEAAVNQAQEYTEALARMLPVAATLYGVAHPSLVDSEVADRVFNMAEALAERVQQHVELEVARLAQAKEDSGL